MPNLSPLQQNAGYSFAVAAGVIANVILGGSSLFWRALAGIPPTTLLSYRILISFITLILVMSALSKFNSFWSEFSRKVVTIHASAAVLVAINWGTFIWASIYGHVVESGLGYLIAPFVAIGVGTFILKDPMSRVRRSALFAIAICVLILILRSGELSHWVYLVIGITWGGYAYLKKITTLDAFTGLLVETAILSLCLLLLLPTTPMTLILPQPSSHFIFILLAICGLVTTIPLWLFARAASYLPLSVMGFFQFVLPSTQLVVALLFYHQVTSTNTLFCFSVIWLALLVIVAEPLITRHRLKKYKK
jgi:chloramphenicol-sensitive protein RarD